MYLEIFKTVAYCYLLVNIFLKHVKNINQNSANTCHTDFYLEIGSN